MNFIFVKHQHSSEEEVQVPCAGIKERMEISDEIMKMKKKKKLFRGKIAFLLCAFAEVRRIGFLA